MQAQRDPQVEGLVRLGRATEFRQADGGAATTRAQLARNLRPQHREALARVLSTFRGAEEASKLCQKASAARALGAGTVKELASCHQRLAAGAKLGSRQARLREQQLAKDQQEAEVRSGLGVALEDHAKLSRLYQEQQEQAERAASLMRLYQRAAREVPKREEFVQHQRLQTQAVRARMSGEAGSTPEVAVEERVEEVACSLQREVWQQLNTASMAAAAEAALLPPALLLTGPAAHTLYEDAGAVPPYTSSAGQAFPGGSPDLQLEPHLHLPRASPLRRPVAALMLMPPWKLARAVWQLAVSSHERLVAMREGWDPLADAKRHRQAAGEAVDPLYQVRLAQQALTDAAIEVISLQRQLERAGRRRQELAQHPAVGQALRQPAVWLRLQADGRRASLATARSCQEDVVREAAPYRLAADEGSRLYAVVMEAEREDKRLEGLIGLLAAAQGGVFADWRQQYAPNQEFLQRMLPGAYGEVADASARGSDRLARCVAELARVPPDLLPVLAEERRRRALEGGGGADAGVGGWALHGTGLPGLGPLPLLERLRLALPYVGSQRSGALLRAAAASGPPHGEAASAHGSMHLPGSASSSLASSQAGSLLARGSGSAGAGGGGGVGFGGSSSSWQGEPGAMAGWRMGAGLGPAAGRRGSAGEQELQGGGGGGGGGGFSGSGSWLRMGGVSGAPAQAVQPAAAAVTWRPGAAALGLPAVCYWLAALAASDTLAPLRCPAALMRELQERFQRHAQEARWLAAAEGQLQSRHRQLSALQPTAAALRDRLLAKRSADAREWLGPLARSRAELLSTETTYTPRVKRAMRELEEQGAVRLVPWRKVNGRTAAEFLDEIRSTYARIHQLQQQPYQPRQPAFGPPPAIKAGF